MRNRILAFSGVSVLVLTILMAFNNCSSQKGPSAVDKALSSTSPTPAPTPTPSPGTTPAAVEGDSEVPAGAIMAFARSQCPAGWLKANGDAILRSAFANLYNVIGNTYGAGDGSTTFNLPDMRGYFLRGVDDGAGRDPQAAARTARADGTVGDTHGTVQEQGTAVNGLSVSISNAQGYTNNSGWGYGTNNLSFGAVTATVHSTDPETRPKNISVLYCISTGGQ